ncbi:autotransporter-associated beta strand repeat-containing protein [Luteolibacter yonseiensis]|uniref:Autotransporter-associated beta strand repeat-containing protein n=1 Tax=Luteolibacter yonseiensis TaxID=1144680 RepID=A0A934QZI6_9BACT|nr:autotransporter-associated beta strand repeat-containing protein [Luteolibacter yonseiensis]MBK1814106.1 autotransporter-associated beta strand repeat-containing protein [Luteolibacter yonseiensis]
MKPTRRNPLFANFFRGNTLATAVVLSLAASGAAGAANAYWDSNGTTAGAGATPTGTWGTSAFWNATEAGTTTTPGAWVTNNVAIFSAGTDATSAYTVTIAAGTTQTIGGLTVQEGTPTITGGTALALNNASTPFAITGTGIVNSVISGSGGGIAKTGTGTLVIGSAANTFTGNITVTGPTGALQMTSGSNGNATSAPLGIANAGGTAYKTVTLSNGGIFRPMANYNSNVPSATLPGNGYVFMFGAGGGIFDTPSGVTLTVDDGTGTGTGTGNSQLQGTGDLTKTGAGTLALGTTTSNFSVFTGNITISDGVVNTKSATSLGAGSNVLVQNAANPSASDSNVLQIVGGFTHGTGKTLTLRNNSTSNIANARAVLENQSGNNTWAGNIVFDQGMNQSLTSTAGVFTVSGFISSTGTPPSSVFLRGASSGVITGGINVGSTILNKTDGGSWTISSSGNGNGPVRVSNGSLILNNTNAVSPSTQLTLGQTDGSAATLTVNAGFTQEFVSIVNDPASTATATQTINGGGSITTGTTNRTYTISDPAAADDVTINTPILGSGGFTKAGPGTLVVNNSVTGPVTVNAGTLRGAPSFDTGLTLNAGTVFTAGTTGSGVTVPTPLLTLGTGATTLNLNAGPGGDLINVGASNGLTAGGTTTINVTRFGGTLPVGVYPLINFSGTVQGGGSFVLGTIPPHLTANLVNTGSSVALNVTSSDYFVWTGTNNGTWDTTTANNWNLFSNSSPVLYQDGEAITFGNTGLNPTVVVATPLSPGWVTFSNSTGGPAWRITGAALTGIGGITKTNTGTATIANAVSLTGNVLIQGGTLEIDHDTGSLTAAAAVNVSPGATLLLSKDNGDFTFDRPVTGTGTVKVDPVTSTTGPGSRTVTLSGNNTGFSGVLKLSPSGTAAANGTFRTAGATSQVNLGAATLDIDAGAQLWFTGSISNNMTITGAGFSETQANSPATAATDVSGNPVTVPGFTYSGHGAIRMDGATITGNITLDGNAGITAYNTTGIITGAINNVAPSDTLVVGGGGAGTTLILSGDASGLERIWVNGGGTAGTSVLQIGNNDATGTLASNVDVILYNDGAGAVLRVNRPDAFTLEPGQKIIAAHNGTATNLTKAALQTNVTGAGFSIGSAGANVVDLSDGINGGTISVGNAVTGAVLNIDAGATIEIRHMGVGDGAGFSSTVNQTGGSVAINGANTDATNNLRLGHWATETSTYNLTGGTLSFGSAPSTATPSATAELAGGIYVGVDGTGIFNQSGGTVTTNYVVLDNRGDTAGTDQYNLSAGTLNLSSAWGIIRRNISAEFSFSGGTIRNSGSGIVANIDCPLIVSNTPVLDTNGASNGLNLVKGLTGGAGTLTAQGGGAVYLNDISTFPGTLSITDTTVLGGTGTFPGTATVRNVSPGATTAYGTTGTLTLGDAAAATVTTISGTANFDLNSTDATSGFGNDLVAVNGDLDLTNSKILPRFYNGAPGIGAEIRYTLYTYTGTRTGTPTLDPSFTGVSPSLTFSIDTSVSGVVSLVVTGTSTNLTWTGGAAGNTWDVNNTVNWSGASKFYQLSTVTFDDTGSNTPAISLVGTLIPSTLTVDTSTKSYTFSGSGGIGGGAQVTKSGSTQLTLLTNNTYTGTTFIGGGIVQVGNGGTTGTIGAGATTIFDGAELQFNRTDSISQTGIFEGGGTLVQEGTGTFTLQNANSNYGPIRVDAGILKAANVSAFGTSSGITIASGGQVNLNGTSFGNTRSYSYTIAGNGPDSRGAIINEVVSIAERAAVYNLTLSGNASVGAYGPAGEGNRFDIGYNGSIFGAITGNGFTLTKVGDNLIGVRAPADNISYVVAAGTLRAENSNLALGSTGVTVNSGARLDSWGALIFPVPLTLADNSRLTTSSGAGTWNGNVALNGTATFAGGGTSTTLTGVVSGTSGAIVKAEASALILSGNNTYTGGSTITGGTLQANSNNSLGTAGVVLSNTAVAGKLVVNGGVTIANNITIGNGTTLTGVSGRGLVEQLGTGQAILTGDVIVNSGATAGGTFFASGTVGNELVFNGAITINAAAGVREGRAIFSGGGTGNGRYLGVSGTVLPGVDNGLPTDLSLLVGESANGTFDLNGKSQSLIGLTKGTNTATVTNTGATPSTLTLDIATGTTNTYAGTWAGSQISVVKNGAGTLALTGAAAGITGNILVSQGVLSAGAQNTGLGQQLAARTITVSNGATLAFGINNVFGNGATAVTALPAIVINGGTLTTNSYDVVGKLTLNGATVTDTRTGALTGFQAYEFKDVVTVGGTAPSTISSPGSFGSHLVGNITFDVADATSSAAADLTVSSRLINATTDNASAAGGLVKAGAGTMVLSGVNSYTGNTVVNAGTLSLADNAQLRFVIGATSGTNNTLTGAGTAVIDGDFAIDTTAAAALTTGTWVLENVPSLTGAYGSTFSVVNPDGSPWTDAGGNKWTKAVGANLWTFDETTGTLTVGSAGGFASWSATNAGNGAASGDFDGDGVSNGVEWVLGGTGTTKDLGKLPAVSTSAGNLVFTFVRDQQSISPDTVVTIEVGTSLASWPEVYVVPGTAGTSGSPGTVAVTKDTPAAGKDTVTLTVPQAPDAKKFARLKVNIVP